MASKIFSAIVFVFNLVAFGLAVAAEQRRSTAKVVQDTEVQYNYCVYDSDRATGYGVGAFLFSVASQLLIMLVSRCFCCGKPLKPGGSRALALLLFIVSWMFFLIAEICLLAGSVENAYHTKYRTMFMDNPPDCQTLRKGVSSLQVLPLSSSTPLSLSSVISSTPLLLMPPSRLTRGFGPTK